jgi:hypothetical protein
MDSKIIPAYVLIDYVWQVLKDNTDMDEGDYAGLVPIVALSEEPEIKEFDKPYIVYGFAENTTTDGYANNGNMSLVVYSANLRRLANVTNIIARALDREDETARDINRYSSQFEHFIGLRFGDVSVSFVEGGSPEETEGGRISSSVNIRYQYFVDYDIDFTAGVVSS